MTPPESATTRPEGEVQSQVGSDERDSHLHEIDSCRTELAAWLTRLDAMYARVQTRQADLDARQAQVASQAEELCARQAQVAFAGRRTQRPPSGP